MEITRNCLYCNNPFKTKSYLTKKYCNVSCASNANKNCLKSKSWTKSARNTMLKEFTCEHCGKMCKSTRMRYCSKRCANKVHWNQTKTSHYKARKERGLERKQELIKLKGGRCEKCGYSKCMRALTFHHKDPQTKVFTLDQSKLATTPMSKILLELEKCTLLCFNCHMEEHS